MRASKCWSACPTSAAAATSWRLRWIIWRIDVTGWICLDVGASTGGFTDCLLQRGAARSGPSTSATASSIGSCATIRAWWSAKASTRAIFAADDFPEKFDLAVCDASFISPTLLIPAIVPLLTPHGEMMMLVKPQFEVERGQVGKGGIVRDPALHQAACDRVRAASRRSGSGLHIIESPILGAEGNREFLLYASRESNH